MYQPLHDGFVLIPVYIGLVYSAITFFVLKSFGYDIFTMFGKYIAIAIIIAMYFIFRELCFYVMNNASADKPIYKLLLLPIYPLTIINGSLQYLYMKNIPIISHISSLILRLHDGIVYLLVTPYTKYMVKGFKDLFMELLM